MNGITSTESIKARIAELNSELRDYQQMLKVAEKAEEIEPVWKYTLSVEDNSDGIMDDTIIVVKLFGEVTNRDQGKVPDSARDGGMRYYFNTGTGKFITSTGGGSVIIADRKFFRHAGEEPELAAEAFDNLAAFLSSNPEGGDVTGIVNWYKKARDCEHLGVFAGSDDTPQYCGRCDRHVPVTEL